MKLNVFHPLYRVPTNTKCEQTKTMVREFCFSYLLGNPLAALMSSSATHSAIVLMFLFAASRSPVVSNKMAWFTRLRGEISTACLLTTPADPILVAFSHGPLVSPDKTITMRIRFKVAIKKVTKIWVYLLTMPSMIT